MKTIKEFFRYRIRTRCPNCNAKLIESGYSKIDVPLLTRRQYHKCLKCRWDSEEQDPSIYDHILDNFLYLITVLVLILLLPLILFTIFFMWCYSLIDRLIGGDEQ